MRSDLVLRAATPDDLARLRSSAGGRGLERHLARPRYRAAFTRVAERGGALAGCALIGHRRLRLGAATLEVGAIERIEAPGDQDAFVALLGDCLGALLEQGQPLATLLGDTAVYTPFGFAPYAFSAVVDLEAGATAGAAPLRPAGEADLDDLAALYEASYRDLPLGEVRAAPDWRAWLAAGRAALALEDGRGRVAAYAALGPPDKHGAHVAEAAAADAGAARALLIALQGYAHGQGLRQIGLALAPAHPVARAALHLGGEARVIATADDAVRAALAGVVDLPAVLEALAPEFELRLEGSRYAGWSGNLRVETETERVTLALAEGRAAVIDGSRAADLRLRQVRLPALSQLLLGYRAAADLRATGGLDCDDSALGLIDVLFPSVLACQGTDDDPGASFATIR
jgi:hypothetical protein